ncbi:TetR/AcrR family transcriptional regulator, partial [Levilactobacillus brevis]
MKRETKKKINRQKLVDAAFELMSTQGIQETSVKAVSEAAGISFVTMYKYFPTKDDLVMAVVQRLFEKHMTAMMVLAKDQSL